MKGARGSPKQPGLSRRTIATGIGLVSAALAGRPARSAGAIRLTDVVGREVVLPGPATRIVLGSGVTLDALSLLHPDPALLLVGWGGDTGANRYQLDAVRRRFPTLDQVPIIARNSMDSASTEAIIAARPDLVVLSRLDAFRYGSETTNPDIARMDGAGIPVLIVDFLLDPIANTQRSMQALGKALGREEQADAFLALYRDRVETIAGRLAKAGPESAWPSVMFHAFAASPDCCWTIGASNNGGLVRLAGGRNIGAAIIPGPIGQLSLEYVYSSDPKFYVASGGRNARPPDQELLLGRGVDRARAESDFKALVARPAIAAIDAVASGRAYAIWHNFVHTPLHVVGVEALARWFHPDLFADRNPGATLAEINRRFMAIPVEGTFWIDA